jgi:hypothetical protein
MNFIYSGNGVSVPEDFVGEKGLFFLNTWICGGIVGPLIISLQEI